LSRIIIKLDSIGMKKRISGADRRRAAAHLSVVVHGQICFDRSCDGTSACLAERRRVRRERWWRTDGREID
jgi:hypothetical protein